jgi:predicted Rossmann-fold nucleotide-binding protein
MKYIEIESEKELLHLIENKSKISTCAFQNLDFHAVEKLMTNKLFVDCIFLGCKIPENMNSAISKDCLVFPNIDAPYNPFINTLYTPKTLFKNYEYGKPESYENTLDKIVYNHYMKTGKEADDIKETLSRRLHDHSITNALYNFIADYDERKIVAIMGGHGLLRDDRNYLEVARISKRLCEAGYLMISGGGPGAMEATHVGAWMAGKTDDDLIKAIKILSEAPNYKDKHWLDKSYEVLNLYPISVYESLAVPTWLYGHEPPSPFATKIAKYFANSVREDGLLTIAKGGIIFTPGSAGTVQEIFQELTQNHYLSFGYASPMVFFNTDFWTNTIPLLPLFDQMIKEGTFQNVLLSKCDNCQEVFDAIESF